MEAEIQVAEEKQLTEHRYNINYQCINSQDICYTYYVANPGDGLSDLTAIQDSGVWYEATFAGSVVIGNNLYEDRIDFIQYFVSYIRETLKEKASD